MRLPWLEFSDRPKQALGSIKTLTARS